MVEHGKHGYGIYFYGPMHVQTIGVQNGILEHLHQTMQNRKSCLYTFNTQNHSLKICKVATVTMKIYNTNHFAFIFFFTYADEERGLITVIVCEGRETIKKSRKIDILT